MTAKPSAIHTRHWLIHKDVDKPVDDFLHHPYIQEAASLIREDEVVAFPTETVYGLGANALSDKAVQKIFTAKGRPADNPLIIHIATLTEVDNLVDKYSNQTQLLMNTFWPGPLTLILPHQHKVCPTATAGLSTVAVRMPDHPLALALIRASGKPLAAPSANLSGKPSPTSARHVWHDLRGRIAGVLDGGRTGIGLESTVLDVSGEVPLLLRPGGVTVEQIEQVTGSVELDPALHSKPSSARQPATCSTSPSPSAFPADVSGQPKSPGLKYRHYAPEAQMWLVSMGNGRQAMVQTLLKQTCQKIEEGYRVGILTTDEHLPIYRSSFPEAISAVDLPQKEAKAGNPLLLSVGSRAQPSAAARHIYDVLRQFDAAGVQLIYAETFPEQDLGQAVMNRLRKAADHQWIQ